MKGATVTDGHDLRIRVMRPGEIALAADWAAAEGWNPGHADAACFATVDPHGFLLGELDGQPAATISCVNYDDRFAFLGFYIVRPDLRGCGLGLRIWNAAMAHAGMRTVGLDGVVAQQENYRKSGFRLAYPNIRYGGATSLLRPWRISSRWERFHSRPCKPMTRRSFRRHARRSCAPGSRRRDMSGARSCATGRLPPGA
jgi:GNAT superfamily N-acetyltransferase